MERKKRRKTAVAVVIALMALSLFVRQATYKQVIYSYQRLTETEDTKAREKIERLVGKADTPYDRLPRRPRYIHFWDKYNARKQNEK